MATLTNLIDRVQDHLQDSDGAVWSRDRCRRALLDASAALSRDGLHGEIRWLHAQADQGTYDTSDGLPPRLLGIDEMTYNGSALYEMDEARLTYQEIIWEEARTAPRYWTMNLQGFTTVRVLPIPALSGSAVPVFPAVPLVQALEDNFVLFTWEDPMPEDASEAQEVAIADPIEQCVVYDAVARLVGDEGEFSDPVKATGYHQLARLIQQFLLQPLGIDHAP